MESDNALRRKALQATVPYTWKRVEGTTGLRSLLGPAEIRVVDRAGWIRANIASFRSLLDPVLAKWLQSSPGGVGRTLTSSIGAQVAGDESRS